MWTPAQYLRLVRASGWYDLSVTIAFVTPWSFQALHGLLSGLGLPGRLPAFEPAHVLMANLMGSIVCVWALLRIRHPQQVFGRYDALGRLLFATWQAYALSQGASLVIALILFFELLWALFQWLPVRAAARPSVQAT